MLPMHVSQAGTGQARARCVHAPVMLSGTITTRTVLSTLAETSIVAVGLNFRHVDGRSCTFRIDSRGCEDGQILASA
jgi:hypothetical protein